MERNIRERQKFTSDEVFYRVTSKLGEASSARQADGLSDREGEKNAKILENEAKKIAWGAFGHETRLAESDCQDKPDYVTMATSIDMVVMIEMQQGNYEEVIAKGRVGLLAIGENDPAITARITNLIKRATDAKLKRG